MTQSLMVVATEPGAGKSAICLGLLDQFERHGVRAGFFKPVGLTTATTNSPFTCQAEKGGVLTFPIAHGEGCYYADERTLDELEAEDRVVFRYVENPNGSMRDIAGILSRERNVMGLMPHPERACDQLMGSSDGLVVFQSMLEAAVRA